MSLSPSPTPSISSSMNELEFTSLSGGSDGSNSVSSKFSISSAPSTSTGFSPRSPKLDDFADDETLAANDTKHLVKLRFCLITILFWSTVGVGLAVWIYFTENIENEFNENYREESLEILGELENRFLVTIGTVDSFVLALCAQFTNWPFVTIPHFSVQADRLRKLSHAVALTTYYYVDGERRPEWEDYISSMTSGNPNFSHENEINLEKNALLGSFVNDVNSAEGNSSFLPKWQQSPEVESPSKTWDGFQSTALTQAWKIFQEDEAFVMSYVNNIPTHYNPDLNIEANNAMIAAFVGNETDPSEPFSDMFYPIMENCEAADEFGTSNRFHSTNGVVGVLGVTFFWRDFLSEMLSDEIDWIYAVIENTCNQTFTYTWSENIPVYLGNGDLHDSAFESFKQTFVLSDITKDDNYMGLPQSPKACMYMLHLYPSAEMTGDFRSNQVSPGAFTGIAVIIFIFTSMVFVLYDCLVERRQKKVYTSAMRNNAIVSSLFPKNVRDRLYKENDPYPKNSQPARTKLKTFMREDNETVTRDIEADTPIADLFSNCTVLFADIAGFTSWASERSPSQVFVLLETIYGAFDKIADRRGVFKVETVGDCYMAVTGLPNPTRDHAVVMARFARDCRDQMIKLTATLEVTLGPETSDLSMRFGLHSGPVTAGVLRGQKSRFQLFGDTVNTASRLESTGASNKIHLSEETARLLKEAGKSGWLTSRDKAVQAKGKGELRTYWAFEKSRIRKRGSQTSTVYSDSSIGSFEPTSPSHEQKPIFCDRRKRLIDWNVDLFAGLIRKIVARRNICNHISDRSIDANGITTEEEKTTNGGVVLDEVVEIIELPAFNPKSNIQGGDPSLIELHNDVTTELRKYILMISTKYNPNPFHSFEHASHVTMSVAKLLSRIVAPDLEIDTELDSTLHDHTYGITSDPLTHFACIFAALIHDVDHQGVPNSVLAEEGGELAIKYEGRSIAEQNSVDIAWSLFLQPQFNTLRNTVCASKKELNRLRQLLVNMVLATDIMDKDLKKLRNERWEKAFSSDPSQINENDQNRVNRKATIVLEHLIQASDVCHTMQHWHVYRKWNERLFKEMYLAFKIGRTNVDPATFWYEGELGFFDHYIIPLSKKLSECGVFGVSSDEYLNYALRNRKEWEQRGEALVNQTLESLQLKIVENSEEVC